MQRSAPYEQKICGIRRNTSGPREPASVINEIGFTFDTFSAEKVVLTLCQVDL